MTCGYPLVVVGRAAREITCSKAPRNPIAPVDATVAITSTSMRNTGSASPEQRIRVLTGRSSFGMYLARAIR